jgi:hypothetical protein
MVKVLTLGLVLYLALPAAAWGQAAGEFMSYQAGVQYMGAKQVEKQCPNAPPGPFACPYPPSPYPPSRAVPPMEEAKKVYQGEVDQAIQQAHPENDTKKKAIQRKYQEGFQE